MAQISVDNGLHFVPPQNAIRKMDWDVIVHYMDDAIAERVHDELAPCSKLEFLRRYLELAPYDLIIG